MTPKTSQFLVCVHPGCRIKVGLNADGACAWHDPVRRKARARAGASSEGHADIGDLPVREIRSMADAERLAQWLPIAIATGVLGGREGSALVAALREYRMTAADADFMREFEALRKRVEAAKAKGMDI